MPSRFRYIFLAYLILVLGFKAAAQLAMPDNVFIGAAKNYYVDPNPISGSTYIWTIDGVTQMSSTTNEIDITWNTAGTFLLEVQEFSAAGCPGSLKSGQVVVSIAPVLATADLSVLKTVDNAHPFIGQRVVFTVVATNIGTNNGTDVKVTDIIESGYSYISSSTTTGNYDPSTSTWSIGSLDTGESDSLTITATVNSLGSYSNTAIISGVETDSHIENNVSTVVTYPTDFFIPDGFSPNGDGINDLFIIRGIFNHPDNTFVIFNRWGNKVFEASSYKNTWDGRSMFGLRVGGDKLPTGTYFYVLDLKDGSTIFKGTIYLNR